MARFGLYIYVVQAPRFLVVRILVEGVAEGSRRWGVECVRFSSFVARRFLGEPSLTQRVGIGGMGGPRLRFGLGLEVLPRRVVTP